MIEMEKQLHGSILDIGGGGEGIIGRLYGCQVTAIDCSAEELAEAPDDCEKAVMDATDLQYDRDSFDNVTFFYSLMYMTTEEQRMALSEAARVLKHGGKLVIWDCEITAAWPEPFCVELDIALPDQQIHTTYGIVKRDTQSSRSITELCVECGLTPASANTGEHRFYLCFEK